MKQTAVVMGKGELACKVASWFLEHPQYRLACVVPNVPPSLWTLRLEDWARTANIPVVHSGLARDVPSGPIDLAVSVTYQKIVKSDFISRCREIINIHNGPLPQYRGMNPINWALKNNEREHGVTIHRIAPGIDDGPVFGIVRFPINPEVDEVIDVYERCLHFGWKLFKETVPKLREIAPQPQDESQARYFSAQDFAQLRERSYFTRRESAQRLKL